MQKSKSHGSSVSRRQFLRTGTAAGAVRLPEQARPLAGASTMLTVDYRKLVSRADLTYIEPVARSEEGMPVGNGRMGSLVWTSPAAIKFQINRVDVFANNRDSRSFPERHTDYSAGCGYVDIDFGDFGDDVFAAPGFRQHLAVYDALATVQGNGITARVLGAHDGDVIAVEVDDQRALAGPVAVVLRMLRYAMQYHAGQNWELTRNRAVLVRTRNHTAASKLDIREGRILLTQEFREGDYYSASAVAAAVIGRKAKASYLNEAAVRLSAAPGRGRFTILIASTASFDPQQDAGALALQQLERAAAEGFEGLLASNQRWWSDYWSKAFIRLHSADGVAEYVEQNYTYFLYLAATAFRGAYPPRFGGLIFGTNGDMREWGAQHWWHNLSCYCDAFPPANRFELLEPGFSMYSGMYESCVLAARQQWGSQGLWFPETVWFDGLAKLPEDIAAEMRELYLLRKPWDQRSVRFREFAESQHPHSSRWNWKGPGKWVEGRWVWTDKGAGPYGEVNHIFSTTVKIGYLYWVRYLYTLDREWLRDRAYPVLRGAAEFYRNYPKFQKGPDGRYHIHDVNDHEPIKGAQDTLEELTAMHFLFPTVIRASEILDVDTALRSAWRDIAGHLFPLPTNDLPDALDPQKPGEPRMWCNGCKPLLAGNPTRRSDHLLLPAIHYDLCNVETADSEMLKVAHATFESVYPGGANETSPINVLSRAAIAAAHLGRARDVRFLIPNQMRCLTPEKDFCDWVGGGRTGVLRNRLTLREGPGAIDFQRLGRAATALHLALLQSVPPAPGQDPVTRVFAAWPREWDAEFTLLTSGAFLVTSAIRRGTVEFVELRSQAGGECRLRNPWGESEVSLYRAGRKAQTLSGSLLRFGTARGETIVVVPADQVPERIQRQI